MMKAPILATLASLLFVAAIGAAGTSSTPQTNVLQNININLTVYQQNATNATRVTDKVTTFNTKDFIEALGVVTGTNFGTSAKLVFSTVYGSVTQTIGSATYVTVLSSNWSLPANTETLSVDGSLIYSPFSTITITSNQTATGSVATNVILTPNGSVTNNTNSGFVTTLTPSVAGGVTNIALLVQQETSPAPTETVLSEISSGVGILYGPENTFFPVSDYLTFSTNSAEIVVESGSGLNTTNELTSSNLTAQTAYSIQGLNINYFTASSGSTNNLMLGLTGFVRQSMKVDHIGKKASVDVFGAGASWNAIGPGYAGGTFTTNSSNAIPILSAGYLTNASPIVAEGTVTVSFLKNLAQ